MTCARSAASANFSSTEAMGGGRKGVKCPLTTSGPFSLHPVMPADKRTLELQAPTSKVILSAYIDPKEDLARERQRASFDVAAMTRHLYGAERAARNAELDAIMAESEVLTRIRNGVYFMTREELYKAGLEACRELFRIMFRLGLNPMDDDSRLDLTYMHDMLDLGTRIHGARPLARRAADAGPPAGPLTRCHATTR